MIKILLAVARKSLDGLWVENLHAHLLERTEEANRRPPSLDRHNNRSVASDMTQKKSAAGFSKTKLYTNASFSEANYEVPPLQDPDSRINLSLTRKDRPESEEPSPRNAVPEPSITLSAIAVESLGLRKSKRVKQAVLQAWLAQAREQAGLLACFRRRQGLARALRSWQQHRRATKQSKQRIAVGYTFYRIRLLSKALFSLVRFPHRRKCTATCTKASTNSSAGRAGRRRQRRNSSCSAC